MLGQVWRNGVKYLNRKGVVLVVCFFVLFFNFYADFRCQNLMLLADFTLPCESIVKAKSPQGHIIGM